MTHGLQKIKMSSLQELTLAFPTCTISEPDDAGVAWITDKDGESAGHIKWRTAEIILHSDYKKIDEVVRRIGPERITDVDRDV